MKLKNKNLLSLSIQQTLFFILLSLSFFNPVLAEGHIEEPYKIAVLAYKGKEIALKHWAAHADYLNRELAPLKFEIIPLTYTEDELAQAVIHREVDFVITNPTQYIELELDGHVSRLATRRISCCQTILDQFGGTAITLSARKDINTYADLADKKILIPSHSSLGGWQVHLREGLKQGVDFRNDAQVTELKNHKKVVMAVLAQHADAGFVRSGLIEKLIAAGELQPNQLKVINLQKSPDYPYQLSTTLYPEWPIAVVSGTAPEIAVKVLHTLLKMSPNERAAITARLYGWTIAGHYSTVNDLFREAGIGVYAPKPLSLQHVFSHYQHQFLFSMVLLCLLFFSLIKIKLTNKNLYQQIDKRKYTEALLKKNEERLELAMQVSHEGIWDWDLTTDTVYFNAGYYSIAGYEPEEFPYSFDEWRKRVHLKDLQQAEKALARYLAGESKTYDAEFRFLCKDKSYIWIQARGKIVAKDGLGNPTRVIGTHADISEYYQIRQALYQSESLKNNIVHTIPDLVWLKDMEGVYLICNPLFENFFGAKEADIIGKTDYDFVDANCADFFREHDLTAIKADKAIINEEWVSFDGREEKIFLETTKAPLKTKEGKLLGILGIGHDITHRKQKEQELQELNSRLKKISASLPGMIYQYKLYPDGRSCLPYASAGIRNIYQVSPEDVKTDASIILAITHPDDIDAFIASIEKSAKTLQVWKHEFRVIHKDGSIHWLFGHSTPEREENGCILWHGFITDISERKHADEKLKTSEANLSQAQQLAHMGSWTLNVINQELTWSAEVYRIFELDPESFQPTYEAFLYLLHPEDKDKVSQAYNHSLETMHPYNIQHRLLMKNGDIKYINERCETTYDIQGNPLTSTGYILDVTEQKYNEQQLINAQQAADSANKLKSEFLANMSHEIRTPMNAILGFTDILKRMETDEKKANYLQTIQTSGKSLLNLINDILDLSKIESGKMELHYSALSIPSLFAEIKGLFSQKVQDKGLIYECKIDDCIPETILFDESRLRQILVNLISNSVKFTHHGFIKLNIGCDFIDSVTRSSVNLNITITDSGIGIPKDQQQQIFESFSQVKGQKETLYGGTGLGLTITKRIMNLAKGTITVESEIGVGTCFKLTFPNIEIALVDKKSLKPKNIDIEAIHFKPAKILITDDVDYNREILAAYLADWEFELSFAGNGQEAIEKANEVNPDLILLDMKMPIMDGYEASEKLKASKQTKAIPIIAVTAFALNQDEQQIRQHCEGYLRKPVNRYELIKELTTFLPHKLIKQAINSDSPNHDAHNTASEIMTLSKELITQLPDKLQQQLKQAIASVDIETLEDLLKQVTEQNPQLSAAIKQKIDDFEYESLLTLFKQESE